jgi:DNA-binding NarL/FixJ family response regulator
MAPAPVSSHFLVVDDHALLREGITSVIRRIAPEAAIDQADSLREALSLIRSSACTPDMLILDLQLPDSQHLATLQVLRDASPSSRIAIVSAHNDLDLAMACIREGACAFVPKQGSLMSFQHALQVIAQGGLYFPRDLFVTAGLMPGQGVRPRPPEITPRQSEVLAQLLKGCSNSQIGLALGISAETVKLHVSAILQAYGVASRVHLLLACAAQPPTPCPAIA